MGVRLTDPCGDEEADRHDHGELGCSSIGSRAEDWRNDTVVRKVNEVTDFSGFSFEEEAKRKTDKNLK